MLTNLLKKIPIYALFALFSMNVWAEAVLTYDGKLSVPHLRYEADAQNAQSLWANFEYVSTTEDGALVLKLTDYGASDATAVSAQAVISAERTLHIPELRYTNATGSTSNWWATLAYHGTAADGSVLVRLQEFGELGQMISGQVFSGFNALSTRQARSEGNHGSMSHATLIFYDAEGAELARFEEATDENGRYQVAVPEGEVTYLAVEGGTIQGKEAFNGRLMVLCLPDEMNACHVTAYSSLVMRVASLFSGETWAARIEKAKGLIAEVLKIDRDPAFEVIANWGQIFDEAAFMEKVGADGSKLVAYFDLLASDLLDGYLDEASAKVAFKAGVERPTLTVNYAINTDTLPEMQQTDADGNVTAIPHNLVLQSLSTDETSTGSQVSTQDRQSDVILKEVLPDGSETLVYQNFQVGQWRDQLNLETTVLAKIFSLDVGLLNLPEAEKVRVAQLLVTKQADLMQEAQAVWLESIYDNNLMHLVFNGMVKDLVGHAVGYAISAATMPSSLAARSASELSTVRELRRTTRADVPTWDMGWVTVSYPSPSTIEFKNYMPLYMSAIGGGYSFDDFTSGLSGKDAFTQPLIGPNLMDPAAGGSAGMLTSGILDITSAVTEMFGTTYDAALFPTDDTLAPNFPDQNAYCSAGEGQYVASKKLSWSIHTLNNVIALLEAASNNKFFDDAITKKTLALPSTAEVEVLKKFQEGLLAYYEGLDAFLAALDIVLDIVDQGNPEVAEYRTGFIDPLRNEIGNTQTLIENALGFIPNSSSLSGKESTAIVDLIAGKDSAYKNKKFGFILDSGRGASTFIAGTVLSLFAPATRMEKGKKEPCKVGKNDEYSCKEFTYFIAAKSTGLINKDTRPQLYEMVDTYETELDLIFQDQISQIIANTQRQKHFKYFKTEIINEIKGAIIDFGSMNALLTAATKAPDDPVSMFHAAFGVIVTQLKGASKELARTALTAAIKMALGTNTAGLVLSANQVTGLLTAQFALPDEYPFEIKVNNSQLSFAAPQLQYKALDYQVTSFLDYDRLGLDKETFPCYGKEISSNLCSNNEFFLAHNVRSDVDKKNVLMVAHSEKFARTRSTAEFYFTQSQASVERVINSGDTDKVMLQWTYNVQKLKTGGEVSDESDWFDFNPEANQVPSPNDPAIDGKITADQILDHLKESNGNAYFDFFDVLISTQSKWLANNVGFLFDRAEASVLASHRTSGVFREVFTFEFIDPELGTACGDAATVSYPKQNIAYYKLASTHDFMKGWHSSDPNSKGVISHQENNAGNPLLCLTNASETALSMLAYYSEADEVQNYIVNDLPLDGQVCVSKEQYEQYTFLVYDAIFSQYAQAHQLGDDYLAMTQLSDGNFQSFVNKGTFGSKSFIIERTADQFNGNSDIKLPIVSSIDPWESDKSFFPRPFEVSATEADGTPLTAFTINVVQQPAHGTLAVEDQTIIYDLLDRDFLGEDSFTFSVTNASGVVSEGSTVALNIVKDNISTSPSFGGTSNLNDTGITWGGDYPDGNNDTCTGETISAQDCSHGRDVTHNDDSDGHAGFSFTKIDGGNCVQDNVTGLMWEVKQGGNGTRGDEGLHDADDEYNWYNTNPSTNGGADGYADDDGDICYGYDANNPASYCNTQAYVARVNAEGYCGFKDWRMPNREELRSIVDYGRHDPAIDVTYFPNTQSASYWSGSPVSGNSNYAWGVDFYYGYDYYNNRDDNRHVRLVRGGQ